MASNIPVTLPSNVQALQSLTSDNPKSDRMVIEILDPGPSGAPASQSTATAADLTNGKVKLVSSRDSSKLVVFEVTPDIMENRNVNYKNYDPVHAPGSIHSYSNSPSRTFSLSGVRLPSRTPQEATKNIVKLNILRSWTMPNFGASDSTHLGAPPEVLFLTAYSSSDRRSNIYNIPVVITNLSIPYPSDVDYIGSGEINRPPYSSVAKGTPFPTLMNIDIVLSEVHSPADYSRFSLQQFKDGNMDGF